MIIISLIIIIIIIIIVIIKHTRIISTNGLPSLSQPSVTGICGARSLLASAVDGGFAHKYHRRH